MCHFCIIKSTHLKHTNGCMGSRSLRIRLSHSLSRIHTHSPTHSHSHTRGQECMGFALDYADCSGDVAELLEGSLLVAETPVNVKVRVGVRARARVGVVAPVSRHQSIRSLLFSDRPRWPSDSATVSCRVILTLATSSGGATLSGLGHSPQQFRARQTRVDLSHPFPGMPPTSTTTTTTFLPQMTRVSRPGWFSDSPPPAAFPAQDLRAPKRRVSEPEPRPHVRQQPRGDGASLSGRRQTPLKPC